MTKAKDMARLVQISGLILDVRLGALKTAASKRQQSLDLLENLNAPAPETDLSPLAMHQADARYQKWAEVRRAEINILLARQTAEMHVARDAAAVAFGKDQALRGLSAKLR